MRPGGGDRQRQLLQLAAPARGRGARGRRAPHADALDFSALDGVGTLGITAGASAPEVLVDGLLARLREKFDLDIAEKRVTEENVVFRLPAMLAD